LEDRTLATVTDQLERLAALLERGHLTQAEFDQQKAALLATTSGPPPTGSDPSIPAQVGPAQVGAYRILSPIGQGGMGAVYLGRHRSDTIAERQGGDVAIKVMHTQFARNPDFQARFEREASLGLKLDHPGIVKVHDLVVDAGTLALVMEHVEGRSLADVIGKEVGPIPWSRAWPMFEQLLSAVEYAHGQGVIHRDLKPDNVIVGADGRLKILDFGIAKVVGGTGATATGVGMGTVDYMAPEQHTDAKNVDERADVYALGMTLYEMLAGRLPWGDDLDAVGVLHRKLSGDIPPPTAFYPGIPTGVVGVVMGALASALERRTPSVLILGRLLAGAASTPPAARSSAAWSQPQTQLRTRTKVAEPPGLSRGLSNPGGADQAASAGHDLPTYVEDWPPKSDRTVAWTVGALLVLVVLIGVAALLMVPPGREAEPASPDPAEAEPASPEPGAASPVAVVSHPFGASWYGHYDEVGSENPEALAIEADEIAIGGSISWHYYTYRTEADGVLYLQYTRTDARYAWAYPAEGANLDCRLYVAEWSSDLFDLADRGKPTALRLQDVEAGGRSRRFVRVR